MDFQGSRGFSAQFLPSRGPWLHCPETAETLRARLPGVHWGPGASVVEHWRMEIAPLHAPSCTIMHHHALSCDLFPQLTRRWIALVNIPRIASCALFSVDVTLLTPSPERPVTTGLGSLLLFSDTRHVSRVVLPTAATAGTRYWRLHLSHQMDTLTLTQTTSSGVAVSAP